MRSPQSAQWTSSSSPRPSATHFRLAQIALTSGADVYLEKPPVASMDDFTRLLATEQETGRVVQVGFQSLGSRALEMLREDAFDIGSLVRVSAVGAWSRTVGYWSRSPWAGHRSLHGQPVVDGVVTNPLAHAVATALAIVGCRRLEDVEVVETDLYRANAIDSDDTSVVRIRTNQHLRVTCALTLCAPDQREPQVHIEGSRGRATFAYTTDRVDVETEDRAVPRSRRGWTCSRTCWPTAKMERRYSCRWPVPEHSCGYWTRSRPPMSRSGSTPAPFNGKAKVRIGARSSTMSSTGSGKAALSGQTFVELGVPWAHPKKDQILARAHIAGAEVALYRDGQGTIPTSSPRPVLHPVRTLTGVVVTANHPADHDWHSGVGMAIPDVNGTHFWGGGTYVHGQGYVLLDNHGVITGEPPELR